jgi:hypothetical protein
MTALQDTTPPPPASREPSDERQICTPRAVPLPHAASAAPLSLTPTWPGACGAERTISMPQRTPDTRTGTPSLSHPTQVSPSLAARIQALNDRVLASNENVASGNARPGTAPMPQRHGASLAMNPSLAYAGSTVVSNSRHRDASRPSTAAPYLPHGRTGHTPVHLTGVLTRCIEHSGQRCTGTLV